MSATLLRIVFALLTTTLTILTLPSCQKGQPANTEFLKLKIEEDELAGLETKGKPKFDATTLPVIGRPLPMQPVPEGLLGLMSGMRPEEPPCAITKRLEIAGHVVGEDGKPAVGSQVLLIAYRGKLATTTCQNDGRFAFGPVDVPFYRDKAANGRWRTVAFHLVAYAPDRSIVVSEMQVYADADRPSYPSTAIYRGEKIDIELRHGKARTIRGRIEDRDGKPLSDARVRLISIASQVKDRPHAFHNEGWMHAGLESNSDNEGRFQLGMLPEQCKIAVEVRAEGFACTRFMALSTPPIGKVSKDDIDLWQHGLGDEWIIRLAKPLPQRVQVIDTKTGLPLAGFNVYGFSVTEMRRATTSVAYTRSDANGYAILWLPPCLYEFAASATNRPDYHSTSVTHCRVSSETVVKPYQLDLSPYVVTIEVIDADGGRPIPGAKIQICLTYKFPQPSDGSGLPITYYWGETKSNGTARGRNPFEGYTLKYLQSEISEYSFKLADPQGYEIVEAPVASLEHLASMKPVFRFTLRKTSK